MVAVCFIYNVNYAVRGQCDGVQYSGARFPIRRVIEIRDA